MHLHENALFDLDLGVKFTQDIAQYSLHLVTYSDTKLEAATSNGFKPNHGVQLWFPLKLQDGGSGLRLCDGSDVNL